MDIAELLLPLRIAGADTVVGVLTGTTFHLLNPPARQKYERLKAEVRSSFTCYTDIKYSSAQRLPYLNGVIREGLRIFPPGHGMPRLSPGAMVSGFWVPKGVILHPRCIQNRAQLTSHFRPKYTPAPGPSAKTKRTINMQSASNPNDG
jgi:cytochrome P450